MRWMCLLAVVLGVLVCACTKARDNHDCPPGTDYEGGPTLDGGRFEVCWAPGHRKTRLEKTWAADGSLVTVVGTDEQGNVDGYYLSRQLTGDELARGGEAGRYVHWKRDGEWLGWGARHTHIGGSPTPAEIQSIGPDTLQSRVTYKAGHERHGLSTYYRPDGKTVLLYLCLADDEVLWSQDGPGPAPPCNPDAPRAPKPE